MKKYAFILLGLLSASTTSFVYATDIMAVVKPPSSMLEISDPTDIVANIIAYAIAIAGVLGVLGITWAGIQLVLATGEEEKIKKARYMIIYCSIGVLLAGIAYPLVKIISNLKF